MSERLHFRYPLAGAYSAAKTPSIPSLLNKAWVAADSGDDEKALRLMTEARERLDRVQGHLAAAFEFALPLAHPEPHHRGDGQ